MKHKGLVQPSVTGLKLMFFNLALNPLLLIHNVGGSYSIFTVDFSAPFAIKRSSKLFESM